MKKTINRIGEELEADLTMKNLARFDEALSLLKMVPFEVDLWRTQNMFFELLQRAPQIPEFQNEAAQGHLISIARTSRTLHGRVPGHAGAKRRTRAGGSRRVIQYPAGKTLPKAGLLGLRKNKCRSGY